MMFYVVAAIASEFCGFFYVFIWKRLKAAEVPAQTEVHQNPDYG